MLLFRWPPHVHLFQTLPVPLSILRWLRSPITIGIIVTFMFHSLFNSLARFMYLFFSSVSFSFSLWSTGTAKSTILQVLFFTFFVVFFFFFFFLFCFVLFCFYHFKIWSSGWNWVIRLYLKIPEEFVRLIFLSGLICCIRSFVSINT